MRSDRTSWGKELYLIWWQHLQGRPERRKMPKDEFRELIHKTIESMFSRKSAAAFIVEYEQKLENPPCKTELERVFRNCHSNYCKRKKRKLNICNLGMSVRNHIDSELGPAEMIERQDELTRAFDLLYENLGKQEMRLLWIYSHRDTSRREAARQLGITEDALKGRMKRARQKAERILAAAGMGSNYVH